MKYNKFVNIDSTRAQKKVLLKSLINEFQITNGFYDAKNSTYIDSSRLFTLHIRNQSYDITVRSKLSDCIVFSTNQKQGEIFPDLIIDLVSLLDDSKTEKYAFFSNRLPQVDTQFLCADFAHNLNLKGDALMVEYLKNKIPLVSALHSIEKTDMNHITFIAVSSFENNTIAYPIYLDLKDGQLFTISNEVTELGTFYQKINEELIERNLSISFSTDETICFSDINYLYLNYFKSFYKQTNEYKMKSLFDKNYFPAL